MVGAADVDAVVAAGVAAGLGALGLAKLLRRKKKDAASAAEETIQQNV